MLDYIIHSLNLEKNLREQSNREFTINLPIAF